jgi:hypothetical protein
MLCYNGKVSKLVVRRRRSPPNSGGGLPPNGAAESALSSSALGFVPSLHQARNGSKRQLSSARPAPPPNKRMNPSLLFVELTNALPERESQSFHRAHA